MRSTGLHGESSGLLTADDPFDAVHITVGVEKDAMGDFSVPACSPRLLIITFHRLGQAGVDHVAHVGFVDAHSERYGGTDDLTGERILIRSSKNPLFCVVGANLAAILIDPLCLHAFSVAVTQPCVIGESQQPCSLQTLCHGIAVVAGQAVNNTGVT